MATFMKRSWCILILVTGLGRQAAGQVSELTTGRAYYAAGEFKKAAKCFQLAIKTNPVDAESYYWAGRSNQVLADIAAPFDGMYNSKARAHLTKAVELAPDRRDYRRELFDFLLDSAVSSRVALRQAANILSTLAESDPDYSTMRRRFEFECRVNSSASVRLGRLFLAAPRAVLRVAELPSSAVSNLRGVGEPTPAQK